LKNQQETNRICNSFWGEDPADWQNEFIIGKQVRMEKKGRQYKRKTKEKQAKVRNSKFCPRKLYCVPKEYIKQVTS
jgi:hypothetical protein